jgi:hypothetical protein
MVRRLVAALARFLHRLSQPPVLLQVHIANAEDLKVAQKLFERDATPGEKLAWASEQVEKAALRGGRMVGVYTPGDRGYIRMVRGPREFDACYIGVA